MKNYFTNWLCVIVHDCDHYMVKFTKFEFWLCDCAKIGILIVRLWLIVLIVYDCVEYTERSYLHLVLIIWHLQFLFKCDVLAIALLRIENSTSFLSLPQKISKKFQKIPKKFPKIFKQFFKKLLKKFLRFWKYPIPYIALRGRNPFRAFFHCLCIQ